MTTTELPQVLRVEESSPGRFTAPNPETDPEGRDVVFSGQVLAQMIMASSAAGGGKEVKSVHAIFARTGRYSAGPMDLLLDSMHQGRAWASDTITVLQGDRLLARGLVLLNTVEPDVIRHAPAMPDVPDPDECPPVSMGVMFPDADVRTARSVDPVPGDTEPVAVLWAKAPASYGSVAADQAIVSWCEPGLAIGAAMRAHRDTVSLADAHRSISTGVISHTVHFHDHADVGDWLLYVVEGTFAGNGRVFGSGSVFTRDGALVSTFGQDAMVRRVEGDLDPKSSM